ncbi:MAG: tetratricopeptide repeat protein [Blastocatellia bacterium]
MYSLFPPAMALIASINTLFNGFASDDQQQVLNNAFIKSFDNLPVAFTTSVWAFAPDIVFTVDSYFRPVFNSLLTINYALFGTTAWGWHLVNLLIHAAVTFLVFIMLREVTERNWLAALAATLFAVHPVHAESVAWVSGVTDPLMALLVLPAFYFYLRFRKQGRKYFLVAALVFYFLALLSKETALALPLVVAYCDLSIKGNVSLAQRLVRLSMLLGLFAIPTIIYFFMRYNALGTLSVSGTPRYPLGPALLTAPLAAVKYVGFMLIPWGYSYQHYTDFLERVVSASFLVPLLLLIATAIGIVMAKSRTLNFAAVWFIVMLAPALAALRQFEPAYLLQERYLYIASIGMCLAIALGIEWLWVQDRFGFRGRMVAGGFAVLLVLLWCAVNLRQNRVWNDTLTVFRNTVAVAPRSSMSHAAVARSYHEAGRPREAEAEARTAIELDPRCATAYLNLSYFARVAGKLDKACEYLEEGISAVPLSSMTRHDLATMYLNLGLLYNQRNMFDLGEQYLMRSIEISPRAVAWYYSALNYQNQGRYQEALLMYQEVARHVPLKYAPIHLSIGAVYEKLQRLDDAREEYQKYLELTPQGVPDRKLVAEKLKQLEGGPALR